MNKLSFVCASALTAFALSAVAQPQTSPPFPRTTTRSR